jgi:nitrile hydratase
VRTGRRGCTRWPRCCGGRGLFNSDELRNAIERLPPEQYLAASYYERWLGALEMLVAEKGVLP